MVDEHEKQPFLKRNALLLQATLASCIALVLKFAMHVLGWEFVPVNPLLAGIVAAGIFLLSFLLSGVWADYKESEKLPGELASSLEAVADDALSVPAGEHGATRTRLFVLLSELGNTLHLWFYKKKETDELMRQLERVVEFCVASRAALPDNSVSRVKQEVASMRRVVARIRTIRATESVSGGYLVA